LEPLKKERASGVYEKISDLKNMYISLVVIALQQIMFSGRDTLFRFGGLSKT